MLLSSWDGDRRCFSLDNLYPFLIFIIWIWIFQENTQNPSYPKHMKMKQNPTYITECRYALRKKEPNVTEETRGAGCQISGYRKILKEVDLKCKCPGALSKSPISYVCTGVQEFKFLINTLTKFNSDACGYVHRSCFHKHLTQRENMPPKSQNWKEVCFVVEPWTPHGASWTLIFAGQ